MHVLIGRMSERLPSFWFHPNPFSYPITHVSWIRHSPRPTRELGSSMRASLGSSKKLKRRRSRLPQTCKMQSLVQCGPNSFLEVEILIVEALLCIPNALKGFFSLWNLYVMKIEFALKFTVPWSWICIQPLHHASCALRGCCCGRFNRQGHYEAVESGWSRDG